MIVWRVRGKIIRSVLCSVVGATVVHSAVHTHLNRPVMCLFRTGSSMRLVRLKPQGPGRPVQRKFTKYDHFGPRNF